MSMNIVNILASKSTPEISLDPEGIILIKGRSMKVDWSEFYEQVDVWIDEYILNPADLTIVDIYLEYFDEINLYFFISLLKKIESVSRKNKKYIINWRYDEGDEDILEKGENISFILEVPFNFIKIDDPLIPEYDLINWEYPQRMNI